MSRGGDGDRPHGMRGVRNPPTDTDDVGSAFIINGSRLMERANVEPKRAKVTSYWSGSRDHGGPEAAGPKEYITRLTALRDSLLDQEQVYLAQALDRLRLHSLSNKNSSYRLRMSGDDPNKSPPLSQRRNMVTTVEKFRQMRPKPAHPVIFPLQGRQLLEQVPQGKEASEDPITAVGNVTSRTVKEGILGDTSSRSVRAQMEEMFQTNLQRIVQPTSSIPNIGRKALKHQENLEPKTQSLANMRSRIYKQTGRHLASPFLPIKSANGPLSSFPSPSPGNHSGELHQPHHYFSINGSPVDGPHRLYNRDILDPDKMDEYRYEDYADVSRPRSYDTARGTLSGSAGERGGIKSLTGGSKTPQSPQSKKRLYKRHPLSNGSGRYKKQNGEPMAINGSSEKSGFHRSKFSHSTQITDFALHEVENANGPLQTERSFRSSVTNGGYYSSTGDESEAEISYLYRSRLPAICQGDTPTPESHRYRKYPGKSSRYKRGSESEATIRYAPVVTIQSGQELQREVSSPESFDEGGLYPPKQDQNQHRKHIVVDMPSIIFNAPSPVPEIRDLDEAIDQGQYQNPSRKSSLTKTVKQQEIRRKELNNLLEDVKELNMRTEALSSHSNTNDVALQQESA